MNITCDKDHVYRVDGNIVPGATEVMAAEGLVDLRRIPVNILEAASALGTEVHSVCELFDKSTSGPYKPLTFDITKVDDAILPYLKGWLQFRKDYPHIRFTSIEEMIYSKQLNVCGKPDRVGMDNKEWYLIDLKTTTTMQPSVAIQTALYQQILEESKKFKIKNRWAVQLKPDGTYYVHEYKNLADHVRATAMCIMYQYKKAQGLLDEYTKEIYQTRGV